MSVFTDNLRRLRRERKLSQQDIAEKLGMTRQAYCHYENEKRRVDIDNAMRIADILGVTLGELSGDDEGLFGGFEPIRSQKLPLLGKIACGEPIFDEITDTYISVSADIKADFCLVCKGDSMINARIHDGDVVMIQRADIVDNGRIAAVAVGDEVTLKRVYYYPEKDFLELRPENPSYESLIFTGQELEQVRIIGLAVAFTSLVR
ncbi:MAG: helix-turn-helix domain-containing protein [Oscillospiraceae bacterium]|nr:helix-turn-helix domain-containing protein [Oscillospiraceae bacterium]